jgi:hypothetical protein
MEQKLYSSALSHQFYNTEYWIFFELTQVLLFKIERTVNNISISRNNCKKEMYSYVRMGQ